MNTVGSAPMYQFFPADCEPERHPADFTYKPAHLPADQTTPYRRPQRFTIVRPFAELAAKSVVWTLWQRAFHAISRSLAIWCRHLVPGEQDLRKVESTNGDHSKLHGIFFSADRFVPHAGMHLYQPHQLYRPSTHVVLSGVNQGCNSQPPPSGNDGERERGGERVLWLYYPTTTCRTSSTGWTLPLLHQDLLPYYFCLPRSLTSTQCTRHIVICWKQTQTKAGFSVLTVKRFNTHKD